MAAANQPSLICRFTWLMPRMAILDSSGFSHGFIYTRPIQPIARIIHEHYALTLIIQLENSEAVLLAA